jgi:hypothetical protein
MALCSCGVILLWLCLTGEAGGDLAIMGALALFGVGLGLFIAPNNTATMASAPNNRTGEAGGLLNLVRVLGSAIGIAIASTTLSWRLKVLTGTGERTVGVATQTVLAAVSDVLWILLAFSIVAGSAALLRGPTTPKPAATI